MLSHAKHLIGDTIRRNASPVRLEGALEGALATSRASLDSAGSDERPREACIFFIVSCNET